MLDEEDHADPPPTGRAVVSGLLLLACLAGAVVLLAKGLGPTIESWVANAGAPRAVVGVIIAALVLLPEGVAATRAAVLNRLQTSLNLCLGFCAGNDGLTIPRRCSAFAHRGSADRPWPR